MPASSSAGAHSMGKRPLLAANCSHSISLIIVHECIENKQCGVVRIQSWRKQ